MQVSAVGRPRRARVGHKLATVDPLSGMHQQLSQMPKYHVNSTGADSQAVPSIGVAKTTEDRDAADGGVDRGASGHREVDAMVEALSVTAPGAGLVVTRGVAAVVDTDVANAGKPRAGDIHDWTDQLGLLRAGRGRRRRAHHGGGGQHHQQRCPSES